MHLRSSAFMGHPAIQSDLPLALRFVLARKPPDNRGYCSQDSDPATIPAVMSDEQRVEKEDRELVRRMASKESAALDAFYQRYNRIAFSLILRIVGSREDAEDVLTDVFWQVWQQSTRYDSSRGKPIAWLLTIARTRAIDSIRSTNRQQSRTDELDANTQPASTAPEPDSFVLADTRNAVKEALHELPEQQRIPLEMAYFQGMSHTEIATALGQPLGTVKDRIRNGMMHLRKRLKAYV
jgi:RNA polymerase sigma-70 factor, ECF subfamily